ncbi:YitT family protein [Mycoplasma crocodyli]|uniref:ABC transporter, permease protein n=1 Tax=Mycoplasma crocodyli (strain ATCC 51981 / MP145) TaxID=512564 RepID=D5E616_MYCCM|nr:YitT family protein [Mycoplasma crocodyli]ADE19653.1 ABC transporter, permease protein [Mycoplasma crocodyli MP145]
MKTNNQVDQDLADTASIDNSFELNKNLEINQHSIDEELELIKYSMGKHLLNNKTTKLTFRRFFTKYWRRILIVIFASFIFNFGVQLFMDRAQTIPSGLTGIPTLLQYAIPAIKPYFALVYFAVNIPLFLTYGLKIKRSFTWLTIVFMISQILINMVFTNDVVHSNLIRWFELVPGWVNEPGSSITWPILIYGSIGSFIIAVSIALTWKAGGSTGGTDIIVYYYSTKSKKNVATMMSLVSFSTATIFLIIFSFVKPNVDLEGKRIIFGMRELSTYAYILITNIVLNFLYPKYKKVVLSISCSDPSKVLAYLKLIKYWHGYEVSALTSGYTGKTIYRIESVMLLLETKNMINDLKLVDKSIFVSIQPVKNVIGSFNTNFLE